RRGHHRHPAEPDAAGAQAVNEELQNALHSRIVIEQAKGVLAERADLSVEEAFTRIRAYARHHRRRLVDVAHDVIDRRIGTAELLNPEPPGDPAGGGGQ
ncbi:MAG: ANTAR domain-containing protein, partial [Acidimicrobiales bacterium]